jgi:hypothetical protein
VDDEIIEIVIEIPKDRRTTCVRTGDRLHALEATRAEPRCTG